MRVARAVRLGTQTQILRDETERENEDTQRKEEAREDADRQKEQREKTRANREEEAERTKQCAWQSRKGQSRERE